MKKNEFLNYALGLNGTMIDFVKFDILSSRETLTEETLFPAHLSRAGLTLTVCQRNGSLMGTWGSCVLTAPQKHACRLHQDFPAVNLLLS